MFCKYLTTQELGLASPLNLSRLYFDKFLDGDFVCKERISEGNEGTLDMALSEERFLISVHRDGVLVLRDMKKTSENIAQTQGSSRRVKWYPDDNGLFVTSGTKFLKIWDTNRFTVADYYEFHGLINDIDISNHRSLIGVSLNEEVRLVDLRSGSFAQSVRCKEVNTLRFTKSNKNHVFIGDSVGHVQLWDIRKMNHCLLSLDKKQLSKKKRRSPGRFSAHEGPIISLEFDESHSRLLSLGKDCRVRVWCLLDFYNLKVPLPKIESLRGSKVTFSTSAQCKGDYGFFPRVDGAIQIADLRNGESVKVLDSHYDSATCALYSIKDGGTIYSGGLDRNIFVWGRRKHEDNSDESLLLHQTDQDNWRHSSRIVCKSSFSSNNPEDKPGDIEKLLDDLYKDFDVQLTEPKYKAMKSDFQPFKDEDASIIYDIDEERAIRREKGNLPESLRTKHEIKSALMEKLYAEKEMRSEHGVFDIKELVSVLKKEKCRDMCVLDVRNLNPFFEHIVIVTCKSKKVMAGTSRYIRKLYKYKSPGDAGPQIEGIDGDATWLAMDLGNIALHLFLREERLNIDLESLWSLGPLMDEKSLESKQGEDSVISPLSDFIPRSS